MGRRSGVWIAALLALADAARFPLVEERFPHLPSLEPGAADAGIDWARGVAGWLLYSSEVVEVAPEGIRFIRAGAFRLPERYHARFSSGHCDTDPRALCRITREEQGGSLLLPSVDSPTIQFANSSWRGGVPGGLESAVSGMLWEGACALQGKGRSVARSNGSIWRYDVSACDIAYGQKGVVWDQRDQPYALLHDGSLGPMAYPLAVAAALLSLIGYTDSLSAADTSSLERNAIYTGVAAATALAIACTLMMRHIYFATEADRLFVLLSASIAFLYALAGIVQLWVSSPVPSAWVSKRGVTGSACLFALDACLSLLYRTPETPFAPLVSFIFLVRVVRMLCKALDIQLSGRRALHLEEVGELCAAALHVAIAAEYGLRPQLEESATPAVWPVVVTTGAFAAALWCVIS